MQPQEQQQSPLFSKLPPELRNAIYELVFTPDLPTTPSTSESLGYHRDSKDTLPLHLASKVWSGSGNTAHQKELLTTCKRIHDEASGIYKTAHRTFWHATTFTTDTAILSQFMGIPAVVGSIDPDDLLNPGRIDVKTRRENEAYAIFTGPPDSWSVIKIDPNSGEYDGALPHPLQSCLDHPQWPTGDPRSKLAKLFTILAWQL